MRRSGKFSSLSWWQDEPGVWFGTPVLGDDQDLSIILCCLESIFQQQKKYQAVKSSGT